MAAPASASALMRVASLGAPEGAASTTGATSYVRPQLGRGEWSSSASCESLCVSGKWLRLHSKIALLRPAADRQGRHQSKLPSKGKGQAPATPVGICCWAGVS